MHNHVDASSIDWACLADPDLEQSVPDCLTPRFGKFAERIAVAGHHEVTYRELDRRANQIARWIKANEQGDGGAVALMLDRGAPFIAGLLAVLKIGRVYVGLDPDHPQQRNRCILVDADSVLCISDEKHAEIAREIVMGRCAVLNIDEMPDNISDRGD